MIVEQQQCFKKSGPVPWETCCPSHPIKQCVQPHICSIVCCTDTHGNGAASGFRAIALAISQEIRCCTLAICTTQQLAPATPCAPQTLSQPLARRPPSHPMPHTPLHACIKQLPSCVLNQKTRQWSSIWRCCDCSYICQQHQVLHPRLVLNLKSWPLLHTMQHSHPSHPCRYNSSGV